VSDSKNSHISKPEPGPLEGPDVNDSVEAVVGVQPSQAGKSDAPTAAPASGKPAGVPQDPIDKEVAQRRKNLGGSEPLSDKDPLWGLALSGGGIRSATFCFGVIRALANRQLLLRFDLLSTVSGGGYIGTTVGSLFHRAANGDEARGVQEAINGQFPSLDGGGKPCGEKSTSWFLWWLRANGRYLIPRGVKDTTFAVALYLRNLAGIHFELGLVAILIGLVLSTVDLGVWWALEQLGYQFSNRDFFELLRWIPNWLPTISVALPFLILSAARMGAAYWAVPWAQAHAKGVSAGPSASQGPTAETVKPAAKSKVKTPWLIFGGVLLADVVLCVLFYEYGTTNTGVGNVVRNVLWWTCAIVIALWVTGAYTAQRQLLKARDSASAALQADTARNVLTKRFANRLRWMVAVVLAGMVDRVAWFLAFNEISVVNVGLSLALAAAVLRGLMPLVNTFASTDGNASSVVLTLGRAGGYLLVFLLLSWWVTLVYQAVLGALFIGKELDYAGGWLVLGLLAIPAVGYVVFTGRNLTFLNLSSLHSFYRARLVRSYMGAANASRFGARGALGAISEVTTQMPVGQEGPSIDDVMADDDISLTTYRPQDSGGPVHLINVCVNQTQDPRGRIFNQDRKGLSLTVASGGLMRASLEDWSQLSKMSGMSVGRWMAISGAAIAPGMGYQSRGGLAALMTFAGVRLGYWWSKEERDDTHGRARTNPLSKSKGLIAEVFGTFKGTAGPDWFLSDGGRFENTSAYALLAQRADVIVVADCGADPKYKFGDLENLVRIARVDLHADIQFLRPKTPPAPRQPDKSALRTKNRFPARPLAEPPDEVVFFGSINDLASKDGTACLALARVVYGGDRPGAGILILIKPNICEGLPVDLVNFKDQYPEFPQQPTADQFFSEAQWESYFLLGQYLGGKLNRPFIERLLANPDELFETDECSPFEEAKRAAKAQPSVLAEAGAAISRLPSRIGQSAIGTTLGLGAVATVAISTWQAIDGVRTSYSKETEAEHAALKELTDLWAKVPPPAVAEQKPQDAALALTNLAAAIVRSADTLCPRNDAKWYIDSPVATQITNDTITQCKDLIRKSKSEGTATSAGSACYMLVEASNPNLKGPLPKCLSWKERSLESIPPPLYWGYDYSATRTIDYWHPCEPLRAPLLAAESDYEEDFGPLLAKRSAESYGPPSETSAPPTGCQDRSVSWLNVLDWLQLQVGGTYMTASVIKVSRAPPPEAPSTETAPQLGPHGEQGRLAPPESSGATETSQSPATGSLGQSPTDATQEAASQSGRALPSCADNAQPKASLVTVSNGACKGMRVFVQTYGTAQYPQVACLQRRWEAQLGAKPLPIEDVVETARRRGRITPAPVRQNELRFHGSDSEGCARKINKATGEVFVVKPLGAQFTPSRRTLEVWVAPSPPSPTVGR